MRKPRVFARWVGPLVRMQGGGEDYATRLIALSAIKGELAGGGWVVPLFTLEYIHTSNLNPT